MIEDVLRADQSSVDVNRGNQDEVNTRLGRTIEACFELAKANGVASIERYRNDLVVSLMSARARIKHQQTLDGQDRAVFLGFLDELIRKYEAPEVPAAEAPAPA